MSKQKINIVIAFVIIVIGIAALVYYLMPNVVTEPAVQGDEQLLELQFTNTQISTEDQETFRKRFDEQKTNVQANPDDFNSWMALGLVKKQVGDYKGAEQVWLKATELRPNNSISFANLADLYANFLNDYDRADAAFQTSVVNSKGDFVNASFYRSYIDFLIDYRKDLKRAEEVIMQSLQDNPENSDVFMVAAAFYRDAGNGAKEKEYLQKALSLNPENTDAKEQLKKFR